MSLKCKILQVSATGQAAKSTCEDEFFWRWGMMFYQTAATTPQMLSKTLLQNSNKLIGPFACFSHEVHLLTKNCSTFDPIFLQK